MKDNLVYKAKTINGQWIEGLLERTDNGTYIDGCCVDETTIYQRDDIINSVITDK